MESTNLQSAIDTIGSLRRFGSRPGLDSIRALLDLLGNPQDKLKYVHVAGTNGKGSVCAMLSKILEKSGYKTGLYISPYVIEFRERIQINSKMIPEEKLIDLVNIVYSKVNELFEKNIIVTEFEMITAIAFLYFAEEKCDIVVLETGMGGQFDATNIIKTSCADVITPISLDHTAILGNTIEKICDEKRRILKKNSNVIFYRQESTINQMIESYTSEQASHIYYADELNINPINSDLERNSFTYNNEAYCINLLGNHQIVNASIVIATANALKLSGFNLITNDSIKNGLSEAKNPGRFEYFDLEVPTILDGAHNPSGTLALANTLSQLVKNKKIICIIGMLKDKDVNLAISNLSDLFDYVICTEPKNKRKMNCYKLKSIADKYFHKTDTEPDVIEAYKKAQTMSSDDTVILICGSLYLISEIRNYLNK